MKTNSLLAIICLVCIFTSNTVNAQQSKPTTFATRTPCSPNTNQVWSKLLRKCIDPALFDETLFAVSPNKDLLHTRKDALGLVFAENALQVEVFNAQESVILTKNELTQIYECENNRITLKKKNDVWIYSQTTTSVVAQPVKLYVSN